MRVTLQEYVELLSKMRDTETTTLHVDCHHVHAFDDPLAVAIEEEFIRFEPYLKMALVDMIRELYPELLEADSGG